jgi:iron complex outermembrane receptor protein
MRVSAAAILAGGVLLSASTADAQQVSPEPAPPPLETSLPEVVVDVPTEQQKAAPKKKPKAKSSAQGTDVSTATPPPGTPTRRPETAYGPVQGYAATRTATGIKTDTPLKEVPQSVTVVGTEQMRDQGVQNLQEAIRYAPGVFADAFGYDSRGDYSWIRGTATAFFLDGLRTNLGYYVNSIAIDPYALERVEVLRGPASMLYGQVPTGGIVNAISKLPSEIPYGEITVEYGSFDFKQVKIDKTGTLTEDGKWLYRIVGLARDADTQVDFVENDRLMLAPSLTYRPTNDTSITVLGNFRNDDSDTTPQFLPQIGTLTPNVNGQIVPRDTFVGEPEDYYDTDQESATLFVDHRFGEDLKLRHVSRYTHTENAYSSTYAAVLTPARFSFLNATFGADILDGSNAPFLNTDQSEVARATLVQFSETEVFNSDTNLTATFMTGAIGHKVLGGFDYMRFTSDLLTSGTVVDNLLTSNGVNPAFQPTIQFLYGGLQPAFDIFNPQYGQSTYLLSFATGGTVTRDAIPLTARPTEIQIQSGLYIQDQLRLGPWIAVLGLRQDWLTMESDGSPDEKHETTTGRAALMYELDFGLTPYVSYSTSFAPQPGQPVGDHIYTTVAEWRPAGPLEGEQVEIGFKYQPDGAPFMINASVYELTERNQIAQPDFLFAAVQGADINARGFEIEAIGDVTRNLRMIAAYSYTDAKFEKYPELDPLHPGISDFMVGKPVDGLPAHLASLWAVYTLHDGFMKGLSVGGGVRYVGESESFGKDIATGTELYVKTPSYTLFDAMVAYETEDWRWQLTAQNLEDEYYVVACTAFRGDCGIGQARTIITGFTYKF